MTRGSDDCASRDLFRQWECNKMLMYRAKTVRYVVCSSYCLHYTVRGFQRRHLEHYCIT